MSTLHDDLLADNPAVRIAALGALRATHPRPPLRGTNTHVHTNYSFSVFRSPAEAAWLAYQAGVEIFGINDHYTIDGHDEFAQACTALGLPATFSIEAVAMDRAAAEAGLLLNDPGNPGRMYLCGKGVTRPDHLEAQEHLVHLRRFQELRNRDMVTACDRHFRTVLQVAGPHWEEIVSQTPCGNTTERHIARACVDRVHHLATELGRSFEDLFTALVGAAPAGDDAAVQNQWRGGLLKAGKACYVDEDERAYPDLEALCGLFLQLGAIPTYPVLGNPVTDGEQSVSDLCDRLAERGIYALELIPERNSDDRVDAVIAEARRRNWPVFDGTEHNTPAMTDLLPEWSRDDRFRPMFRESALILLGHQELRRRQEPGYVDADGVPEPGGFQRCRTAGVEVLERS